MHVTLHFMHCVFFENMHTHNLSIWGVLSKIRPQERLRLIQMMTSQGSLGLSHLKRPSKSANTSFIHFTLTDQSTSNLLPDVLACPSAWSHSDYIFDSCGWFYFFQRVESQVTGQVTSFSAFTIMLFLQFPRMTEKKQNKNIL